eukprot:TRINITY_DN13944_c0_g1_i2.p1 TRINITY_DN13944_c0_g1~~TRINITY_DN13944_c0_g1_i2.p1  ORF type:complete len:294 (+),score=43.70 TRINITY_DN13944_c0_g1_i2:108-989(+)
MVFLRDGDWICSACNYHNFASRTTCNQCLQVRRRLLPKESSEAKAGSEKGEMDCQNSKSGDWVCPTCKIRNHSKADSCQKCHTRQPSETHAKATSTGGGGGDFAEGGTCRVWVGGLPPDIDEAHMERTFARFGKIKWIKVRHSARDTFAFVQYYATEDARIAVREMDQSSIFGGFSKGGVIKVAMSKDEAESSRANRHDSSRSRSPPPRRSLQHLTPTVRFENLPLDMEKDELEDYGTDFGRVVYSNVWFYKAEKYGRLEFADIGDAVQAAYQLDDRRLDGWNKRLKVFMPCG